MILKDIGNNLREFKMIYLDVEQLLRKNTFEGIKQAILILADRIDDIEEQLRNKNDGGGC